jgi:hypothetical protein
MGTIVDTTQGSGHPRRHPAWISRYRARARGERGTTLVEAAIVTPVFLLFILAIAEIGLYMKNYLGVANTVRAGARTASAAGSFPSADLYLVNSMALESQAIPRDIIEYIVVYDAGGFGEGPVDEGTDGVPAGCLAGQPRAGQCNVYSVLDFERAAAQIAEETRHREAQERGEASTLNQNLLWFGCRTTGPHANQSPDRFWCPTTRDDTYRNADYVGVYMKIKHGWLTGIFGQEADIEDLSVIRIEPKRK